MWGGGGRAGRRGEVLILHLSHLNFHSQYLQKIYLQNQKQGVSKQRVLIVLFLEIAVFLEMFSLRQSFIVIQTIIPPLKNFFVIF